jgi:hypothetical protein
MESRTPRVRHRPPDTVVAYRAIIAGIWLIALAFEGAHGPLLTAGAVLGLSTLGLWRGYWIAWIFLVLVAHVANSIEIVAAWKSSWFVATGLFLHAVLLGLLVAPATRRHAARGRGI